MKVRLCAALLAGSVGCSGVSGDFEKAPSGAERTTEALSTNAPAAALQSLDLVVKVAPSSTCLLHQASKSGIRVYADDVGFLRFSFSGQLDDFERMSFKLDCQEPNGHILTIDPVTRSSLTSDILASPHGTTLPSLASNPTGLTQTDLTRKGYPRRPDPTGDPAAYKDWLEVVSRGLRALPAVGIVDPDQPLRPAQLNSNFSTSNFSGFEVTQPGGVGNNYMDVMGSISRVPDVAALGFPQVVQNFYSNLWVGLDGGTVRSTDVAQAGVEMDMAVTNDVNGHFYAVTTYYTWAEWYPDSPIRLNVPVRPGDQVLIEVWMGDWDGDPTMTGPNAWIWIGNMTTNVTLMTCIGPADSCVGRTTKGQIFVGDTAEWILERPGFGTPPNWYAFPDFGSATMTKAAVWRMATPGSFNALTNMSSSFFIQDVQTTHILSTANLNGSTPTAPLVNWTWTGPFFK